MTNIQSLYTTLFLINLDLYVDKYSLFINNQALIDINYDDITKLPKKVESTFCFYYAR